MGRLVAVASAVAQNPSLHGSTTIAAHTPAAAEASAHAPAGAVASSSPAGADADLTFDEVCLLRATMPCKVGACLLRER